MVELTEFLSGIASELFVAGVIGIVGLVINHTIKTGQDNRKLEQEKRDAALKTDIDKLAKSVQDIRSGVASVEQTVQELKRNDQSQDRMIRTIAKTNRMNGQCTYELAQLVMVLSEGMRDQHLDGNITRAIDTYRKFESSTLGGFLTGDIDKGDV